MSSRIQLVVRTPTLPDVLAGLSGQVEEGKPQHVRVQLADGTLVQGELNDVGVDRLSLLAEPDGRLVQVSAEQVLALDVARPHRGREWALAGGAIVGGTGAIVAWSQLPGVNPAHGVQGVFAVLFVTAGVIFGVLKRYTPLGRWLRRWETVYTAPVPL